MIPNLKAFEGDTLFRLFRSGIRANQAIHSNFPGGKEAVNMTPERIGYRIIFGAKDIMDHAKKE